MRAFTVGVMAPLQATRRHPRYRYLTMNEAVAGHRPANCCDLAIDSGASVRGKHRYLQRSNKAVAVVVIRKAR